METESAISVGEVKETPISMETVCGKIQKCECLPSEDVKRIYFTWCCYYCAHWKMLNFFQL